MASVRVVTDSTADLDAETAERLGISVVPMTVHFGQEVYLHSELSNDEFWHKFELGPHPGTSQPATGLFEEAFSRLVEAGHQVLCVTLTGKHSGTFGGALSAARRFGDSVKVMDSLSLSLGQGFQVLAAAQSALGGVDMRQVMRVVEQVRERSHLLILLNTIEHVRRGGRADALMPVLNRVSKMLKIKPILDLTDGYLGLHSLARSYERGLRQIVRDISRLKPVEHLAVVHTRCAETAQDVARTLSGSLDFPYDEIIVTETGPVLSVHGGPKAVGVVAVQPIM
jgi:DegV family protein with EDD domain